MDRLRIYTRYCILPAASEPGRPLLGWLIALETGPTFDVRTVERMFLAEPFWMRSVLHRGHLLWRLLSSAEARFPLCSHYLKQSLWNLCPLSKPMPSSGLSRMFMALSPWLLGKMEFISDWAMIYCYRRQLVLTIVWPHCICSMQIEQVRSSISSWSTRHFL